MTTFTPDQINRYSTNYTPPSATGSGSVDLKPILSESVQLVAAATDLSTATDKTVATKNLETAGALLKQKLGGLKKQITDANTDENRLAVVQSLQNIEGEAKDPSSISAVAGLYVFAAKNMTDGEVKIKLVSNAASWLRRNNLQGSSSELNSLDLAFKTESGAFSLMKPLGLLGTVASLFTPWGFGLASTGLGLSVLYDWTISGKPFNSATGVISQMTGWKIGNDTEKASPSIDAASRAGSVVVGGIGGFAAVKAASTLASKYKWLGWLPTPVKVLVGAAFLGYTGMTGKELFAGDNSLAPGKPMFEAVIARLDKLAGTPFTDVMSQVA
jgi:hypothetical protein